MKNTEYIQLLGQKNTSELLREQEELKRKLALVDLLIQMKQEEQPEQPAPQEQLEEGMLYGQATLTANDLRCGLLRFSNHSAIAQALRRETPIVIIYQDTSYLCSVPKMEKHPNQRGRINGVKKVFRNHPELTAGATLKVCFDTQEYQLVIQEVLP